MLVLSRRLGEKIYVGPDVTITIVHIAPGVVRIGIDAPKGVKILRDDVRARVESEALRAGEAARKAAEGT